MEYSGEKIHFKVGKIFVLLFAKATLSSSLSSSVKLVDTDIAKEHQKGWIFFFQFPIPPQNPIFILVTLDIKIQKKISS